jgi:hypothetical protein
MDLAGVPQARGGQRLQTIIILPTSNFPHNWSMTNHHALRLHPKSINCPQHHYTGYTTNLKRRLAAHNRGDSKHTAAHRPWKLVNYFAFCNKEQAEAFEHYLKSGAGRRFQVRHFGE